jgi:hypothetical protein
MWGFPMSHWSLRSDEKKILMCGCHYWNAGRRPGPDESDPDLLRQATLADFLVSTRPVF